MNGGDIKKPPPTKERLTVQGLFQLLRLPGVKQAFIKKGAC